DTSCDKHHDEQVARAHGGTKRRNDFSYCHGLLPASLPASLPAPLRIPLPIVLRFLRRIQTTLLAVRAVLGAARGQHAQPCTTCGAGAPGDARSAHQAAADQIVPRSPNTHAPCAPDRSEGTDLEFQNPPGAQNHIASNTPERICAEKTPQSPKQSSRRVGPHARLTPPRLGTSGWNPAE